MSIRKPVVVGLIVTGLAGVATLLAQAQQRVPQGQSLGEIARKLRAERQKADQQPVKTYTNDNLPARPAASGITVAGQISPTEAVPAAPAAEQAAPAAEAEAGAAPSAEESAAVHDQKYYRKRMGELRSQLELHQRQLAVLEQKLAQGQMQFYSDPNKTLQQESTPEFYSDVNKLRDEIQAKKQEIAADEQAITDLEQQLRREGGPPGWLR